VKFNAHHCKQNEVYVLAGFGNFINAGKLKNLNNLHLFLND